MHDRGELPVTIAAYTEQIKQWPESGRHMLVQFDDETMLDYQAYRPVPCTQHAVEGCRDPHWESHTYYFLTILDQQGEAYLLFASLLTVCRCRVWLFGTWLIAPFGMGVDFNTCPRRSR